MKKTYKVIVAYDGTNYQGWQLQQNGPTIVGTLQKTFTNVFKKEISIFGASRTDSGVHALGQVAVFTTTIPAPEKTIKNAWNNKLPGNISIQTIEEVKANFNPHHNVIEKTYEYTFTLTRPSPFVQRYQWHYGWPIDIQKLQRSLSFFIGEHDFRSFCTGDDHKSTIRTINNITLEQKESDTYTLIFKGPGFLRYMIRRLTGALLEVASRPNLPIDYLKKILATHNPEHTLPTAPSKGLVLVKIKYKDHS